MATQEIREYKIERKSRNVAETPWLILPGSNKQSRRLVQVEFIKDSEEPDKFLGLHLNLMYQKRTSDKVAWPLKAVDLRDVKKDFGFKFSLDTIQTYELFEALKDAYPIGSGSISSGKRTVIRGADSSEIIVTDTNKVEILKKLSKILSKEEISEWLEQNISKFSSSIALIKLYEDRKAVLKEFEISLAKDENEHYWQDFLSKNKWIFGASYINIIDERRIDIHHETDFPFETDGGFMDIVEIKKPGLYFWTQVRGGGNYLYRDKFLIPNAELQGAVAQVSKYILQAEKNVDNRDYVKDHGGVIPLKPRGVIVHGRSNGWKEEEWEAFRLLNDQLHGIQIITFDHLLVRAKKVVEMMEHPTPAETGFDHIPF